MAKEKKIKFPFKPNECVRAAFRQEVQVKRAVSIMTEALAKAATEVIDPWQVLAREHPEVIEASDRLKYNSLTGMVDIAKWSRRKI